MTRYEDIKHEISDESRFYIDDNGIDYIRVTSLLSYYEDKSGLDAWKAKIGLDAANKVRDDAAERGKLAHSEIENHLQTREPSTNPYAIQAIKSFYSKIVPAKEEGRIYYSDDSLGVRFAGTYDQVVYMPELTFKFKNSDEYVSPGFKVCDLKTKDKPPMLFKVDYILKHLLQTSAYATVLNQQTKYDINGIVLIFATPTRCYTAYLNKDKIDYYWSYFQELLLDFYSIQPLTRTWQQMVKQSNTSFDKTISEFINFIPPEIV